MKITLNLSDYEIELMKDALMSRKQELWLMVQEDYNEGHKALFDKHLTDKAACSILYDYISDLTSHKA